MKQTSFGFSGFHPLAGISCSVTLLQHVEQSSSILALQAYIEEAQLCQNGMVLVLDQVRIDWMSRWTTNCAADILLREKLENGDIPLDLVTEQQTSPYWSSENWENPDDKDVFTAHSSRTFHNKYKTLASGKQSLI
jgi:hypothetical protein